MLEIRSPHTLKIRPCRFSAQFEISNIKSRLPLYGTPRRRSKSYLTPPRWRGLGKRSTPVSPHITTRLRKVDENVDLAKFGRLHSAFPHLEFFWVPCWCGVGGPCPEVSALLVSGFARWLTI